LPSQTLTSVPGSAPSALRSSSTAILSIPTARALSPVNQDPILGNWASKTREQPTEGKRLASPRASLDLSRRAKESRTPPPSRPSMACRFICRCPRNGGQVLTLLRSGMEISLTHSGRRKYNTYMYDPGSQGQYKLGHGQGARLARGWGDTRKAVYSSSKEQWTACCWLDVLGRGRDAWESLSPADDYQERIAQFARRGKAGSIPTIPSKGSTHIRK
jgi:hypothetical protein